MAEYKVGDKVRRTANDAGSIKVGTLGAVIALDGPNSWMVRWDDGQIYRYEARHIELHSPAPAPSPTAMTQQPAAAVKVCSSECEERKAAIDRQNKQIGELHAKLNEATGAKLRVGDLLGERDRLRIENHELATRVQWLERELARKGGRR